VFTTFFCPRAQGLLLEEGESVRRVPRVDLDSDDDDENGEGAASLLAESGTSGWRSATDVQSRRHRRSGQASSLRNSSGLHEVMLSSF